MEADVEHDKLLPAGAASNDSSVEGRRYSRNGEDIITQDSTYQIIAEEHSIEMESNVNKHISYFFLVFVEILKII